MLLMLYLCAFLSALCVFCAVWSLLSLNLSKLERQAQVAILRKNIFSDSRFFIPVSLATQLSERYISVSWCNQIKDKLSQAGQPGGDISGAEYIGAIFLIAVSTSIVFFLVFSLSGNSIISSFIFALILGGSVSGLGLILLDNQVEERKIAISRQFPYFLDLAVMVVEAGEEIIGAIRIYIRDNPEQALTEELRSAVREIDLGSTVEDALEHLNKRLVSEDVQNTVSAIVQGRRKGTEMAKVLQSQAETMRFRRSQLAERAAEELKVRLQGPTMLILVAVLILILGPAFLDISQGGLF